MYMLYSVSSFSSLFSYKGNMKPGCMELNIL